MTRKRVIMSKQFPSRPNLEQLKKQAKDLLKTHRSGGHSARNRFLESHPRFSRSSAVDIQSTKISLADAQLVVAREYGFSSWPSLKLHVESIRDSFITGRSSIPATDDEPDTYGLPQIAADTVSQIASMSVARTLGRSPTLGEMREYYARDDVLCFLYDECQMRNIDIAFRKKRWPIKPTSKAHLREIIEKTIESKIGRAHKNSTDPVDSIRLGKSDYLSFHFRTSITSGEELTGFDTIFEADMQGWRRSFEDLCGVIKLLDDFGVCYRTKYSGVRSLHFMIPFEALPRQFNGRSVLSQRSEIQSRIRDYFRRHCGMEKAHGGGVMRLAYSLNEDNGLVSLPISSEELSCFRPWMTNIHNVAIDKPWHGDIPTGASRRMLEFLQEVYSDAAKARKGTSRRMSFRLEIVPKDRSSYAAELDTSSIEKWSARLKSEEEADRVEAAWNLMMTPDAVPVGVLEAGLADENPDVRWYLTESLQKRLDDDAISLAGRMLLDDDQLVRISASDALVLAGGNALRLLCDSAMGEIVASSKELFSDAMYAIDKVSMESKSEVIRSFAESEGGGIIAHSLQKVAESGQLRWVRCYIQQIREFCRRYNVEDRVVFPEAIRLVIPRLLRGCSEGTANSHVHISILQESCRLLEISKNEAIPLITIREIADSLGIDSIRIPEIRMTEAERKLLRSTVRNALIDMSPRQKAHILVLFMLYGKARVVKPSAKVLLRIGIPEAVGVMAHASTKKNVLPHRLLNAVNLLKQIEPSIGKLSLGKEGTLDQICGDVIGVSALIEASKDEGEPVRHSAMQALGMLGNSAAIDALMEVLGNTGRLSTGNVATAAMFRIGQPAIPALIKALREDGNMRRRARCALVLGKIGGPTVVSALIEALQDRNWHVRRNASGALGAVCDPAAVPALIEALEDKDGSVRASAAYALMRFSEAAREAVPALTKTLTDENPWVRVPAARALGAIGDPAAVPALTEALRDENEWVRRYAAEALRSIGTPVAMEAEA
jgi:HEAT repeat protein